MAITGTLINTAAILAGSLLGTFLVRGVSEAIQKSIIDAISLSVVIIGLKTAWTGADIVLLIISLSLGALVGEIAAIDDRLNRLAKSLETRFGSSSHGTFAKGFVTASLVYAVGAMAIMGALENGVSGKYDTLLAKSALDGITSVVFSSAFGIGVAFSAAVVFVYQGAISLLASSLQPYLSEFVVNQMSAAGGLLILGIGLNMLGAAKVKVANLLPAILMAAVLALARQSL